MDENLIKQTVEEYDVVEDIEVETVDVSIEDIEQEVPSEEVEYDISIEPEEETLIDISESMGWVSGDNRYHDSLLGVDFPNQHPITAIRGLREELDEIERLKTTYADKSNIGNYYEWINGAYDVHGYFVSLVPDTSKIKICDGSDIFGVSVDAAGFIGGQDAAVPRDNSYGLIVTSGLVDVRCELDVEVGDYVVCNTRGYAEKTGTGCGYKVLAKEDKNGVKYVVIALGVQADITDEISKDLAQAKTRIGNNEKNIVSAINTANQAYQKSSEATSVSEEAVKNALEAVLKADSATEDVRNINNALMTTNIVLAQAKAIAESAATSAESMRNEAVEKANDAWTNTNNLIKTLEPITSWKDDETGVSGVDYLATQMNDGIATTYDVKVVDEKAEKLTHTATRNAKELQSLMTVIDKYSVGEYSQANGLTLDQAQSILEIGMIYVPTSHEDMNAGTQYHKEEYTYEVDGKTKTYTRWFTPGYLYRWDKVPNEEIGVGWLTIGNNDTVTTAEDYSDESSVKRPTASPWVFFSTIEPVIHSEWEYGYWFTSVRDDETEIVDKNGKTGIYDKNTLYKWEKSDDGNYWFAVATLAGNSGNRATSQIRQTANEVVQELTNAYGAVAGSGAYMKDTHTKVQSIASWPMTEGVHRLATIEQSASDDDSHLILAAGTKEDGSPNLLSGATIVLNDSEKGSYIQLDADKIDFTAGDFTISADKIDFDAGTYSIDADKIDFTAGDIGGRNLIKGTNMPTVITGGSNAYREFTLTQSILEKGVYTFSADVEVLAGSVDAIDVKLFNEAKNECYGGAQPALKIINNHISGRITVWSSASKVLLVYAGINLQTSGNSVKISNIKFEEGRVPTAWTPAPEDQTLAEQESGVMCWKMLPSGCYWWNDKAGTNSQGTPLMRLDTNGLYIKGQVEAMSGDLAGWNIKDSCLSKLANGVISGMYSYVIPDQATEENNYAAKASLVSDGGYSSVRFFAGASPTEAGGIAANTGKFCVLEDGSLYASAANITGAIYTEGKYYYSEGQVTPDPTFVAMKDGRLICDIDHSNYHTRSELNADELVFCRPEANVVDDGIFRIRCNMSGVPTYGDTTIPWIGYEISAQKLTLKSSISEGELKGTWTSENDLSDERVKNTIEIIPESYDVLFDNLQPKRYKYNHGTSGRFHTGYIAQDVVGAIEKAGLTTQDFAGVMLSEPNTEQERWYLRRDEFVSLNTWQIQKLKPRVATLEEKVRALEAENIELKEQIAQLLK